MRKIEVAEEYKDGEGEGDEEGSIDGEDVKSGEQPDHFRGRFGLALLAASSEQHS